MDSRKIGSLGFGIVLLIIGLAAAFYEKVIYLPNGVGGFYRISQGFPYQTLGYILIITGIAFVGVGIFLPEKKRPTTG